MSGAVIKHNHVTMVTNVMKSLPTNIVAKDFGPDIHARMLKHQTQCLFNIFVR